jgi:hypothetical protein
MFWFDSVRGVYFPCFLLVSRVGTFLQALALASHWLEEFAGGTPTAGKTYLQDANHS